MNKNKAIILIAIIIGVLLALQYRSFREIELLVQRTEPENIFTELRVFQVANKQLRANLDVTKRALDETQSKLSREAIDEEIQRLKLLSGEQTVSGEGIEVTFDAAVKTFWLNDLISQLVVTGAEAVAINDVRLLDRTAGFRDIGDGILMRRYFLRPPFKITAIGPRTEMQSAIAQSGGIVDRIEDANPTLKIIVAEREKIIIPAFNEESSQ
ncbi:hypothetical protein COV82_00175 [Candidatus Peregrinibacteria bacterium CG11_big_fil_rev_8_21_14_0_20_46_8]|nr:MAG: hypothetical protein COV82_00175 [Candidatus Peregrinibacteria bacterium CG11_big_fil_rev_8_21_14_0_20_46_8]